MNEALKVANTFPYEFFKSQLKDAIPVPFAIFIHPIEETHVAKLQKPSYLEWFMQMVWFLIWQTMATGIYWATKKEAKSLLVNIVLIHINGIYVKLWIMLQDLNAWMEGASGTYF